MFESMCVKNFSIAKGYVYTINYYKCNAVDKCSKVNSINLLTFSYKLNLIKKTERQAHYFRNNCAIVFVSTSILMTIRVLQ